MRVVAMAVSALSSVLLGWVLLAASLSGRVALTIARVGSFDPLALVAGMAVVACGAITTLHVIRLARPAGPGRVRVALDLEAPAQKTVANIQRSTHAESAAHVLHDALSVYSDLHDMSRESPGLRIMAVDSRSGWQWSVAIPSLGIDHEERP